MLGVFSDTSPFAVLMVVVAAIAVVAIVCRDRRNRRFPSADASASRPTTILQEDLRQLHLESTCRVLGQGWNRLLDDVAETRRELAEFGLRAPVASEDDQRRVGWYARLLRELPCGIVVVTSDWQVSFANRAAERVLGVTAGGLEGCRLTDYAGRDLAQLTPDAGVAIDHVIAVKGSGRLVRLMSFSRPDGARTDETALIMLDVGQEKKSEVRSEK